MRLLVTGTAGFLGGHVARHLVAAGHEVNGFDKEQNNETLHESVIGDLLDPESIAAAAAGVDAIFHLGAIGEVPPALVDSALAEDIVGWTGTTPFEVGIRHLLEDESDGV